MNLFHSLEEYAHEILDAVKARVQHLEQAFGTHSDELAHVVATLEAHVSANAPAAPVVVEPVAVEPVVEVPAAVEATEEK